MKDKPTTFGLSLKQVAKLLKAGIDVPAIPNDAHQQKADLLSDRLSDTLAVYYLTEEEPSRKLSRLRKTIGALAGESVGKLLLDSKTDIDLVRMVKAHGRKLSTSAKSEAEHQTANTIYYAAIAHALVWHYRKITKHSHKYLQDSFIHLSEEDWMPKGLVDLFIKASEYCRARVK